MNKKKIGIFGGSFSPPHLGHKSAAESFVSFVELDKLLIVPAFIPPHKQLTEQASVEHRIDMCKLTFNSIKNAEVSDIEIQRGGKSYTYITLQELKKDDTELYLLVGTDMLLTLDMWKNVDIIFSLCTICYVRRENDPVLSEKIEEKVDHYKRKFGAKLISIPSCAIEISSTELRDRISKGEDLSGLLDSGVSEYIVKRGLYS